MLIRHKLLLSAAVSIGALVLMFALQQYSSSVQTELSIAIQKVVELDKEVLSMRKNEKDFFGRQDLKYVEIHQQEAQATAQLMQELAVIFKEYDLPEAPINSFNRDLASYRQLFAGVVKLQQEIGLDPKSGLYGELRSAVHNVESLVAEHNVPELMVLMLQLRRNEKDFMLRRDLSYLNKFDSNIERFNEALSASLLDYSVRSNIEQLMSKYQQSFKSLVAKEQQLGLDESKGMMGQLREAIFATESSSTKLRELAIAKVENEQQNSFMLGLALFGLIALVLVISTVVIIRSIMGPVERITGVISRIEQQKDLSLRCDVGSNDELGMIGRHFNSMVESFQKLIEQVIESVDAMRQSCEELSRNAISASEGVSKQLNETDMVATAITEMGATIDEIAKNTELAAGKAEQTHHNAQEGQIGVEDTISKIQSLAQQLDDSANVVAELEKDSQTIGSVLDVIRGIAEQTNLLALNAAIEAARAGEQGRGFAVVADEVRSLAMRTQESTEEIASIIQTLQSRTHSIVDIMEQSQKQGGESAQQAASAGTLLAQINADVTNIMDMSTQIAAAIEEQSMVAAEVNKNVVVIRDIAEESAQAAEENATASDEVRHRADYLHQAVSQFKI
ncbi:MULTISPECIES: methyl-accepting chemotaxis protein [Shewanella]|jgi:methyl-accepting chemotaxis protein|uniref:Methyl-accepting chemotaxis protein n=2 Tax=Bacteria TaxID=2 RepID=A0A5N5U1C1_9GAMM|nr:MULTISPECIES: methyl-accepting chemotaxis protein [Shewanella]EKT4489736.1 methyl-accepting chemotaxis protein [Shewanella algae]MBO2549085.1 methyl-accepting chemotaxis protein [Shewanella algae]MBO2570622.1 methyl-accepting chemotaxis protein [Shewanella algae]MBO2579248.1 methyl-accepting chemotaxis protein [Shewanella algae]MBO2583647.1 methyl-accepting chemotaxis protein [Shewanella algae]